LTLAQLGAGQLGDQRGFLELRHRAEYLSDQHCRRRVADEPIWIVDRDQRERFGSISANRLSVSVRLSITEWKACFVVTP
jgi:hypothetical protein